MKLEWFAVRFDHVWSHTNWNWGTSCASMDIAYLQQVDFQHLWEKASFHAAAELQQRWKMHYSDATNWNSKLDLRTFAFWFIWSFIHLAINCALLWQAELETWWQDEISYCALVLNGSCEYVMKRSKRWAGDQRWLRSDESEKKLHASLHSPVIMRGWNLLTFL